MINVFMSHKHREEDSKVARCVRQQLSFISNLELYVPSDPTVAAPATRWNEEIHHNLDRCNALVMLYSDPEQNWDWCLYESGYFVGKHGDAPCTVLHPAAVQPPKPLETRVRCTAATPDLIEALINSIFHLSRAQINMRHLTDEELKRAVEAGALPRPADPSATPAQPTLAGLCARIAAEVTRLEVARGEFRAWFELTTPAGSRDAMRGGAIPHESKIMLSERAAEEFNTQLHSLEWPDFEQILHDSHFDAGAISQIMKDVACSRRFDNISLPLLLSPNNPDKAFRPIVTGWEVGKDGHTKARFFLARTEPPFDLKSNAPIDIISHLLYLCQHFRLYVLDPYSVKFQKLRDDQAAMGKADLDLLNDFRRAITAAQRYASFHRMDVARLAGALPSTEATQLPALRNEWETWFLRLDQVREGQTRRTELWELFLGCLRINLEYMKVALKSLSTLVEGLDAKAAEDFKSNQRLVQDATLLANST